MIRTRQLIKRTASVADRVRSPRRGIVILIYHRVGSDRGDQMNLPRREFDDQMRWLSATQRPISLDGATDELASGRHVDPGVVVTLDDGTADWIEAADILIRREIPATLFVATGFIEDQRPFPDGAMPVSWAALAELLSTGLITVGSHTHDHALLSRLAPREVAYQLDRSIGLIQDRLGVDAVHFAYPKAVWPSPVAEREVRRRFRTAVLAGTRANLAHADLHRLARSPIQSSDGDRWFKAKVCGGMGLEDDVRTLANRLRYRRVAT